MVGVEQLLLSTLLNNFLKGKSMDFDAQKYTVMKVGELEQLGLNTKSVIELFQSKYNKKINLNDMIKVSSKDEGKTINFETWDQISINVLAGDSRGAPNKDLTEN